MTRITFSFRRFLILGLVSALISTLPTAAHAQRGSSPGRNTASVLAAFKPVVAKPSESVVRVVCDNVEIALGTVVAPDGFIVTKASDLKGKIVCKFKDGKEFTARIVGVDEKYDLAILRVETSGLRPIEWRTAKAEVGDFVASVTNAELPAAIGVVSVGVRKPNRFEMGPAAPPMNSGFLGIGLGNNEEPIIAEVHKGSAAEKAGLEPGDIVLSISGQKMSSAEKLVRTIQRFKVGEKVVLKIRRGKDEKQLEVTLARRPSNLIERGDKMNAMGSELSLKRTGFPIILQHDTIIKPKDCGGPLVDLDGKAVGINIARAGRTESYAIPTETILSILPDLLTADKLVPKEDADEVRIASLESELKVLRADLEKDQKALKSILGDSADIVSKRKAAQDKFNAVRKKIDDKQTDLDKVRKDATKK